MSLARIVQGGTGVPVRMGTGVLYGVSATLLPTRLTFASDWSTAIGSTDNAVEDGGMWTRNGNNDERNTVVVASGLDFPTTNVYRCEYTGSSYAVGQVFIDGEIPVGTTLYRRVYWRFGLTSGVNPGSSNHPMESTNDPALNVVRPLAWEMTNSDPYPNAFDSRWLTSYNNLPEPADRAHRWRASFLPDTTYRLEWAVTRKADEEGEGRWKLESRVYTSDNVLLYDSDDFVCTNSGHGNHTLATSGTDANVWTTSGSRTEAFSGTSIGYQGNYPFVGEYMYWGGFAASFTDWCGPYTAGERTG